jgi:hypothetical protein
MVILSTGDAVLDSPNFIVLCEVPLPIIFSERRVFAAVLPKTCSKYLPIHNAVMATASWICSKNIAGFPVDKSSHAGMI